MAHRKEKSQAEENAAAAGMKEGRENGANCCPKTRELGRGGKETPGYVSEEG